VVAERYASKTDFKICNKSRTFDGPRKCHIAGGFSSYEVFVEARGVDGVCRGVERVPSLSCANSDLLVFEVLEHGKDLNDLAINQLCHDHQTHNFERYENLSDAIL
jgi:hypothetical protein